MAKKRSEYEKKFGAMLSDRFATLALSAIFGLPAVVLGFGVKDYLALKNEFTKVKSEQSVQRNINQNILDTLRDLKSVNNIIRTDIKKLLERD